MTGFKVSLNFYTVVTVALTIGAIVYLFDTKPEIAPVFMAAALPFVVGIIGQMQQSAKNTEDIAKLDSKVVGVAVGLDSNTAITQKVDAKAEKAVDGVNAVHGIVDGWRTAMEQDNRSLRATVEELMRTLTHERAVTPPSAPSGSTPAHGTPIGGGTTIDAAGPTTIVVDPDHPVAIEAAQKLKGKPKVGDHQ